MPAALLCLLLNAPFDLVSETYPIGMFSVDSAPGMEEVAAMGVDFVHSYGNGLDLERDIAYLDAAQAAGLRVMYNLTGRRLLAMEDGLAELARLVNGVKDHPALGFWYLYDEPDGTHTPEELAPYYDWLKSHAPDTPVAIACAWTKRWWSYQHQLDLLMIDLYPVQHQPFPGNRLGNMTSFTHSALGQGKPVIPINQCFSWQSLAGEAETYRGSPTAELRYPNVAELRYLQYSGLAQGAGGCSGGRTTVRRSRMAAGSGTSSPRPASSSPSSRSWSRRPRSPTGSRANSTTRRSWPAGGATPARG